MATIATFIHSVSINENVEEENSRCDSVTIYSIYIFEYPKEFASDSNFSFSLHRVQQSVNAMVSGISYE